MLAVLLGVIIGLILAVLTLLVVSRFQTSINRTLNQTTSLIKTKGSVIEPENEDLADWVSSLPNETP